MGVCGSWVFVTANVTDRITKAWSFLVLLFVFVSGVVPNAEAVLVMTPGASGDTVPVITNWRTVPGAIVPITHVTSLGVTWQPDAPVAVTSAGSASVMTTPCALEGPVLVTVTV